jgi:hypothetical protein
MARNGNWNSDRVVLMEVGNAGFGGYRYSLVVDGTFVSGVVDELGAKADQVPPQLENDARDVFASAPEVTSVPAFDGGCFFITMRREGKRRQVAVYARPPVGSALERLVQEMLRHAVSPQTD